MSKAEESGEPLSFEKLALPDEIRRALSERDYHEPTPVQAAAFGPAAQGSDCVVQARTGTGKTAAFGLPLLSARVQPNVDGVQALVLCPTRELALQVTRELEALATHTSLRIVSVYGGAPMSQQVEALSKGAQLVVGTPGRVLDHLRRETLRPDQIRSFVLDECDEMLSMGFLPQINDIWGLLPNGHQTLLFSATLSKDVTKIADARLRNPEFITLSGDQVGALEIQHFVYLSHGNKLRDLLQIIEVENPESAIIFCNTRDETKRVSGALKEAGFKCEWLNADLNQNDREKVMRQIRDNELRFLVCTDVAARGIDISHLTHVINFDFPESSEQYVHRTGRTGRAGRIGTAISLVSPAAIGDLYYLRLKFKIHPIERQLPTRQELKTREETDIIASLALKYPPVTSSHPYYSLARRILSSDHVESLLAGMLEATLGPVDSAQSRAASVRREGLPRRASANSRRAKTSREPKDDSAVTSERPEARQDTVEGEQPERGRRVRRGNGNGNGSGRERANANRDAEFDIRYEVSDLPAERAESTASADSSDVGEPNDLDVRAPDFVNLYVNVGKKDGVKPEDFEQALHAAGVAEGETGKVHIRLRHSFLEVKPDAQASVIEKLRGIEIAGRQAQVELARQR